MKRKNNFDELSSEEQRIIEDIKNDSVPVISQDDINAVCKVAASYYSEKQSILNLNFWKAAFSCFSADFGFIWLLLAFLIGSCIMFTATSKISPISVMTAFVPIPVISFAIRELHYRDGNLVQIEKTCKYAPEKIYFVRLWIGMLFNAVFVLLMGIIVFSQYENIRNLYFCSFIVMFLIGAVVLLLMSLSDNTLPLSLIMAAWILCAIYFLSQNDISSMMNMVNEWILIAIMFISIGLFAVVSVITTRKMYA